uniref:Homing endonuclease LAGLIDADG domain-containing protein n=1 Tax=Ulva intestinalis TaxID=3116 RepID=A0A8K1MAY0_ULVIN|nr:hypothetical protein LK039_mgp04 [Ulva intestinalis]UBR43407.1 hypothetical protein [Ulva intestinalis]
MPNKKPSAQWLTWLIGFAEGDGSFIVTNRQDLMFVITQSNYNIEILHEIKQHLGVGRVIVQSKTLNASRYIAQDQIGLSLIVSLFPCLWPLAFGPFWPRAKVAKVAKVTATSFCQVGK